MNKLGRHQRLLRLLPAALIIVAVALGACANDGDDGGTRGSAPAPSQTTPAPSSAQNRTSEAPQERGGRKTDKAAKPRSGPSATAELDGLSQAELQRAAKRLSRRFERSPEAQSRHRELEQLIARAQPIGRRYQRNSQAHQGTDQRKLQRQGRELLERFR